MVRGVPTIIGLAWCLGVALAAAAVLAGDAPKPPGKPKAQANRQKSGEPKNPASVFPPAADPQQAESREMAPQNTPAEKTGAEAAGDKGVAGQSQSAEQKALEEQHAAEKVAQQRAAAEKAAAEQKAVEQRTAQEAASLIEQLGHESFAVRTEATRRLTALGLGARGALQTGLKHPDPHVRRQCRWLLAEVAHLDFERRLAAFRADKEDKLEHDIPCWARFRQLVGSGKDAKELFLKMLEAEGPLLETAAGGSATAEAIAEMLTLRLQQFIRGLNPGIAVARVPPQRQPSVGSMAAILFVLADPELNLPAEVREQPNFTALLQQGELPQAIKSQDVFRKLLGLWLLSPGSINNIYARLQWAVQYDIPETIDLTRFLLKEKTHPHPHFRAQAIMVLGRVGGKPYAALLAELLDEQTQLFAGIINNQHRTCQVRDVALAWLIYLTGQDFAAYGMPQGKQEFDNMVRNRQMWVNFAQFAFTDAKKREEALAKWKSYVAANPLPPPPERPIPRVAITKGNDRPGMPAPPLARPPAKPKKSDTAEDAELFKGMKLARADRMQVQSLNAARELVNRGHYGEAARILDRILALPGDFAFQPDAKVSLWRCLKPEAERLLGELPPDGRAAYRLQFEAVARQLLGEALRHGDGEALATVSRRFFHTEAGAEATYLLGAQWLDHGQPLRAALYLSRVRNESHDADRLEPALSLKLSTAYLLAGMTAEAEQILGALDANHPLQNVRVTGQEQGLFANGEGALEWLGNLVGGTAKRAAVDGWWTYRRNPMRNPFCEAGRPFIDARPPLVPVTTGPLRERLEQLRREQLAQWRPLLPRLYPVVVGDTVVVRTATHIQAVDLPTGELRWEAATDDPLRFFLQSKGRDVAQLQAGSIASGLKRRFWEEPSFGVLSTDGQSVFVVEGLHFGLETEQPRVIVGPDGRRRLDSESLENHNLLVAYDLATGKLKWEIGGPPGAEMLPLAGALFLGPPLPLGGRLYVLAQMNKETRLLELDAQGGGLINALTLSLGESEPSAESLGGIVLWARQMGLQLPPRRLTATPSYADGILVCQVEENQFVGLHLATQTVRWVYQLPEPEGHSSFALMVNPMLRLRQAQKREDDDRWLDSTVTIAEGRVLLTPPGSDELLCLHLHDGRFAWSAPRQDGIYVAGATQGKALVVGRGHFWALRLSDGRPAWTPARVPLPPSGLPSGQGLLSEDHYYFLPLSSGEIAVIDIRQGRLLSRASAGGDMVPGNLVAARDWVLAQNIHGLWRFVTLTTYERQMAGKAEKPDDPAWLRSRGEIALCDGRTAEAVEYLRRAEKLKSDPRTRQLLADALREGIRGDFPRFREEALRFADTLSSRDGRADFLRELAAALQKAGEPQKALQLYLKLADAESRPEDLERFETALMARRDRWTASQIAEIYEGASEEQRSTMDRLISGRLQEDRLAQFLAYFPTHPLSYEARLRLASKTGGLAAEQLLRQVVDRGSSQQQAKAIAQLAALTRTANRPEAAARYYDVLRGELAEQVCLEGKTGKQLVEALPHGDSVRQLLETPPAWPAGKFQAQTSDNKLLNTSGRWSVPCQSGDFRFDIPLTCDLDVQNRKMLIFDSLGRERGQLTLPAEQNANYLNYQYYYAKIWWRGHLAVAWLGNRLAAFDLLGEQPKLLWQQDTIRPSSAAQAMGIVPLRPRPLAQNQHNAADPLPLVFTGESICFLRERELLAVDTLSGNLLWKRDDLSTESILFGDHELLVVVPREGTEARVFSPTDGRELGRRAVPPAGDRFAVLGRHVITWRTMGETQELGAIDPWLAQPLWRQEFAARAQLCLIGNDELAVLEPQGKFAILALPGGNRLITTEVPPPAKLECIYVLRSADKYILLANEPVVEQRAVINPFLTQGYGYVRMHGLVHGIDRRSGRHLWSQSVENQALKLDQPADLPLLIFSSISQSIVHNSAQHITRLLALDKQNGKLVHEIEWKGRYMTHPQIIANFAEKWIEVRYQQGATKFLLQDSKQ